MKLAIARQGKGRKVGATCAKPTAKNRKKKACVRLTPVTTLTKAGTGRLVLPFAAKVGGKKLPVGTYRVTASARDAAGNVSAPRTVTFRVVR